MPLPNGQTPKRSGIDLDDPPPPRARTTSQGTQDIDALEAKELGGSEFRAQRGFVGWNRVRPIEIATGDFNNAMHFPELGCPE